MNNMNMLPEIISTIRKSIPTGTFPEKSLKELERQFYLLNQLLIENRIPRVALVGRRGAGKSSLVNAIFGEEVAKIGHTGAQTGAAKWHTYKSSINQQGLDVLDTRGFQEGSKPVDADDAPNPLLSFKKAISEKAPDLLLFLVDAKQADAGIDNDLDDLERACLSVAEVTKAKPKVFVVLTHCDQIEPLETALHKDVEEDADDKEEKIKNINKIRRKLDTKINSLAPRAYDYQGIDCVCTYQRWGANGVRKTDMRWNIHTSHGLHHHIFESLPDEAKTGYARLSQIKELQVDVSKKLTDIASSIAGIIAATPIPLSDIIPLTSLQVGLIASIAFISGEELSLELAKKFLVSLGVTAITGKTLQVLAGVMTEFIPWGGLVRSTMAVSATKAVGTAAISYFILNKSETEVKDELNIAMASASKGC